MRQSIILQTTFWEAEFQPFTIFMLDMMHTKITEIPLKFIENVI